LILRGFNKLPNQVGAGDQWGPMKGKKDSSSRLLYAARRSLLGSSFSASRARRPHDLSKHKKRYL